MLTSLALGVGGGVTMSAACFCHTRYIGSRLSTWRMSRALFGGDMTKSVTESDVDRDGFLIYDPAPALYLAATSGLLLSGIGLLANETLFFGEFGLNLTSGHHAIAPSIIAGGALVGIGSQLARGGILTDALQRIPSTTRHRSALMRTGALLAGAIPTAVMARAFAADFYCDPAIVQHSIDAAIIDDGTSMAAFAAMIFFGIAVRDHRAGKAPIKALLVATGAGAGLGLGYGLIGLCNPTKVVDALSLSMSIDPTLLIGAGTVLACNRYLVPLLTARLGDLPLPETTAPTTVTNDSDGDETVAPIALAGSVLAGVGWGLTGISPLAGIIGVSSGATTFWLWAASCLGGTGAVQLQRYIRAERDRRRAPSPERE